MMKLQMSHKCENGCGRLTAGPYRRFRSLRCFFDLDFRTRCALLENCLYPPPLQSHGFILCQGCLQKPLNR
jgi:hypothetical protein